MSGKILVAVFWYAVVAAGAGSAVALFADMSAAEGILRSMHWTVWPAVSLAVVLVLLVTAIAVTVRAARRPVDTP
ncbi:hypothetical protein [Actinotalea sp. K2]|uniref:hypothetical protein n=1 Tax=Actinotalea sp. K2 TaxID=2939438 RepID=UPI002016D9D6|nr:hypothetical protein [Actinotalea sp. K2]MCL3861785.1 hypothetical protein [Actinotalea sp. K2]